MNFEQIAPFKLGQSGTASFNFG